jgi:ketoreductase RED2
MTGPHNPRSLDGKVALVTGSSSGIGAAVAAAFAALGATVVVNSSSSVEAGEKVAASLPAASYVQADVSDAEQAEALIDAVVSRHGRLDVVVNNAGTTKVIPHHDLDAATNDVWERIFKVNVLGTWNVTRPAIPHLKATGDGVVVNITSLAGVRPTGSSIPYAVSKAALNHMTLLIANVVGPEVRVNAVAPGLVDTPWTAGWDAARETWNAVAPLRRTAHPGDVADAVVGVVLSRFVTGQVLVVDGGMALR